jgi:endonuclease/exonuclease/phosphatase family metal-dependent hydrolase
MVLQGSQAVAGNELEVMTLNLQYYASYPSDERMAEQRLREVTSGLSPPDVICVQEGLSGRDVLRPCGFVKQVCSAEENMAQSVFDMVYGDANTLKACPETSHSDLLCNQIYLRNDSRWQVEDRGVERISSDLQLDGGGSRMQGKLAIRSMVWVKLFIPGCAGTSVYVMCTHISGGRFEDQYFVQKLAKERENQPDRIIENFFKPRAYGTKDVGILVGDFNATQEYAAGGPMAGYFKASIANSEGVQQDQSVDGVDDAGLEEKFKNYMVSPFAAIQKHGWTFAYTQEQVGVTSGFGHLIDHMAVSRPLPVKSTRVIFLTNQKFGKKEKDTDLVLTDHNSVQTCFIIE